MTALPLWRNRDFVLLLSGRLLSTIGSQVTSIAYPLLVLAVTHSPAKAGIVGFAGLVPHAVFGLLAGVAADRWDRKRLMIAADGVRALAIASLAASILLDRVSFWQIAVVAFVEGAGSVFFNTAHAGALRAVVPRQQLPTAVGVIRARSATVMLGGPPLGGALFAVGRAVPFLFDAVSYTFSFISLVLMRTPFQEEREVDPARLRTQFVEGFRFLWSQPFLRTCAFIYGLGNFTIPGILLVVVVAAQRHGLSSAGIGALVAAFGAAILIGSLASPLFRRTLSVRAILLLELWAGLGIVAFLALAERLRARSCDHGAGNHAAGDGLGRRGLSHRSDAGPAARPRRERQEHDLAARRTARAARRRRCCWRRHPPARPSPSSPSSRSRSRSGAR